MQLFKKQFWGKVAKHVLIWSAVMHVLAFFVRDTALEPVTLIIFLIAVAILAWRSLPIGLMIAFAEIFVGGHGHLLDMDLFGFSLSIRIGIFGVVMLIWFIRFLKKDLKLNFNFVRDLPWLVLISAVLIGSIIGFSQNDLGQAFDDMNGYITVLYLLPIISLEWSQKIKKDLLQVLFGGVSWLVGFTLLLSYLFTHLNGKTLHMLYRFVRDSRLAEITLQVDSITGIEEYYYRIFMQSQMFVVVALILMLTAVFFIWRNQRMSDFAALSIVGLVSSIVLSMSRSFILGAVAGTGLIFILSFFHGKRPIINIVRRSLTMSILFGIGFAVAILSVVIPVPAQPDITDAAFYNTSAETEREVAISSRWQLLGPMMDEIYKHPILGRGFGEEVTFITDDPRIREINKNGEYTTYRFEWGCQDIWLKLGFTGLLAFFLYITAMIFGIKYTAKKHGNGWIVVGLGGGLVALFVTSIFSPYLNHPIGIGYMLFVMIFIDWEGVDRKAREFIGSKKFVSSKKLATQMTPVVTRE